MRRLLLATAAALAGCVPVPMPASSTLEHRADSRVAPLASGETVAFLDTHCPVEGFREALPGVRVLDEQQASDRLFPWLEPDVRPHDRQALEAFLENPSAARALAEEPLRYLVMIESETSQTSFGDEGLAVGMAGWVASDRLSARLVDLQRREVLDGAVASGKGPTGYAHLMIYGVVYFSDPQAAACTRLIEELARALGPVAGPG